jgi:3-hydroxy-9,10-secoandrosta-1,3,5(10)-triene-9,17-dione monooxygenase reductase component
VTIHPEHPFLAAPDDRDPTRRLRARLVAPVTIWAASAMEPGGRNRLAGLTVGSTMIVDGEPSCVLGVIDPEAELWGAVQTSGRFTVNVLQWRDRNLADVFAGLAPAPGGEFLDAAWRTTAYGPALDGRTWAGCTLSDHRMVGYGVLVIGAIDEVAVDPHESGTDAPDDRRTSADVLVRLRGRYLSVPAPRR